MRVAIIMGTGDAALDGTYVVWSPDGGGTFSLEASGVPVPENQLRDLLGRGLARPVVSGEIAFGTQDGDSPQERAILEAAAHAGERLIEERRRRRHRSGGRLAQALRPYAGILWAAMAVLVAFLAWQGYTHMPEAARSAVESLIRSVVVGYVL